VSVPAAPTPSPSAPAVAIAIARTPVLILMVPLFRARPPLADAHVCKTAASWHPACWTQSLHTLSLKRPGYGRNPDFTSLLAPHRQSLELGSGN
jgi:hypothetical protein